MFEELTVRKIVEAQSGDQVCKPTSKRRPLDEVPKGNEEVKKARTSVYVDALPSDTNIPLI